MTDEQIRHLMNVGLGAGFFLGAFTILAIWALIYGISHMLARRDATGKAR